MKRKLGDAGADALGVEPDRNHGHASAGSSQYTARRTGCYSCPGLVEEGLARLGSPQCQDCRDEHRPISPERFLALSSRVVDGIDMAAIAERLRDVRSREAERDDMSWAA